MREDEMHEKENEDDDVVRLYKVKYVFIANFYIYLTSCVLASYEGGTFRIG